MCFSLARAGRAEGVFDALELDDPGKGCAGRPRAHIQNVVRADRRAERCEVRALAAEHARRAGRLCVFLTRRRELFSRKAALFPRLHSSLSLSLSLSL